ncbi:Poly [ADP-ribose] polymerase 9 [Channa argus]|uniref:Poly [ADP-ribose] polymerase 9 n=1 Tax=Channa argus TaxID=215402 RepID=A0A6G1PYR7_CHAAH|nr:Poly [ADP-ribose] polymerase 9 [Channa argus]
MAQKKKPTIPPERRFSVVLNSGVKVSVWKADLTNFQVDAIVNAANTRLQHYGGLALALSEAGGPQIQKDSVNYITTYGELKTGDAIVCNPGSLPCKKVIHAVGPALSNSSDVYRAEPLLQQAIKSVLDKVKKNHLNSVAIPAISSGLFNYPLTQCANTIVSTVKQYYQNYSHPGHVPLEIHFVNNDEPTVKEMERACHNILDPHMSMTYSQAAASRSTGAAKTSTPTVTIGNVLLILKKGKIEEQQTDVIVNTTSAELNLQSGKISNALLKKAGPGIQNELRSVSSSGYVITTKPYNLHCKEVYHTLCIENGKQSAQTVLYHSVLDCLRRAAMRQHSSIAFPAIGTGGLGFKLESRDDFHETKPSTPHINLIGTSNEAVCEAKQWLSGLLSKSSGIICISNNFIQHFGEQEYDQLSYLTRNRISIKESLDKGHSSITLKGYSSEDVVVAGLQVEAMLCKVQKDFVTEEEETMFFMSTKKASFERKTVTHSVPLFSDIVSVFREERLRVVKMEKVENLVLEMLFELKKNQLKVTHPQTMFQCIPAQFCEMICRVGFHAECAPPEDPAYGEGIYFTRSVKKARELWKEKKDKYLYFIQAEVLIGNSTLGKPVLILPPPKGKDPQTLYDSVHGPDIAVIFSSYQALPRFIFTCERM